MAISTGLLLRGTVWTIGGFLVAQGLRFATSIVLARLLAPELFGTMLIVNSLRAGIELMSDIGAGQNIICNKNADDPEFYNTVWSLQVIRCLILCVIFLAAAVPAAHFYQSPVLNYVMPVTGLGFLFMGFTSISPNFVRKRMQFAKLNAYETIVSFTHAASHILLALISPTIWALVFGSLCSSLAAMIGSYFLLKDVRLRFIISKRFVWQILEFGKWLFISSIAYFLATNFDRLYLAKIVPLQIVGIYGIARSISDLASSMVMRLGNMLLVPFVASHSQMPRREFRKQLAPIRLKFLLLAALGFAALVAAADLGIQVLYDQRYQAAGWMLPVLVIGSWFSMLVNLNESTLLGLGKPSYSAASNSSKFLFLLIALPLSFTIFGLVGGIMVVALADVCRYVPVLIGQRRETLSFGMQDLLTTILMFALIGIFQWLRWIFGFGTSFESLP
jgi:O-antigen/teichoic acid export membrane protein